MIAAIRRDLGEGARFVRIQAAPEHQCLPVRESLLQDLIAAKGVLPSALRDVSPKDISVQRDIDGLRPERVERAGFDPLDCASDPLCTWLVFLRGY